MASHTSAQKGISLSKPGPYVEDTARTIYHTLSPVFRGDLSAPLPRHLRTASKEEAMRQAELERTKIASSGVSPNSPGFLSIYRGLTDMAIKGAAGSPLEVWKMAAQAIGSLLGQPPLTSGKQSGGGGWGICCFIFCAADPDDKLLQMVRRYKDSHYGKLSPIAQGYKRLAIWLVPLMRKYPLVKNIVKILMVNPMSLYAKAFYEEDLLMRNLLYPITRVWVSIYWILGKLYGEQTWKRYYGLLEKW